MQRAQPGPGRARLESPQAAAAEGSLHRLALGDSAARGRLATAGRPLARRRVLQLVAGTAAALVTGCARGFGAAAPVRGSGVIELTMHADTDSVTQSTTLLSLLQQAADGFSAANKGLRVTVTGFMQGLGGAIPAIIAGTGPDIIPDWYAPPYWTSGTLLALDPYIQADNLQTDRWSTGQWGVMHQPFGTFMVPAYFSPMVFAVNLSAFDAAGQSYPDTGWDHKEFVTVCEQMTAHTGQTTRYGAAFGFQTNTYKSGNWLFRAFDGSLMNTAHTQETLSSPRSLAAGEWLFQQLIWPGIATDRNTGTSPAAMLSGKVVMTTIWDGIVLNYANAIRQSLKWRIYPYPVFPAGRMTSGTEDFYGINASTKHPDQAWLLLKWLSYEPDWQRSLMRMGAVPPALNSLWGEWETVVTQVIPFLKGAGLSWFGDAALKGYAIPYGYYRYGDLQADQIAAGVLGKIWTRALDVPGGFKQSDQAVNSYLASSAAQQTTTLAELVSARKKTDARLAAMFAQGGGTEGAVGASGVQQAP